MKNILIFILQGIIAMESSICVAYPASAVIDRIEENYAVVEFSNENTIKMIDIPAEYINGGAYESKEIPVTSVSGKFYGSDTYKTQQGNEKVFYQFRSEDDSVWWILTAEEIGHIPNNKDKYTLYYTDNGTIACDDLPELECECYLYDDIFFHIEREIESEVD